LADFIDPNENRVMRILRKYRYRLRKSIYPVTSRIVFEGFDFCTPFVIIFHFKLKSEPVPHSHHVVHITATCRGNHNSSGTTSYV